MLDLWFHVGLRADLVVFFLLFHVGFKSVMLGTLKFVIGKATEHRKVLLRYWPWHGLNKIRYFMSGWGFVSVLRVPNQRIF